MVESDSIMKTFYVELLSKMLNNAVIGAVAGHNFFLKMLSHAVRQISIIFIDRSAIG